jgi:phosphoribosyl-AMP cyclohydrolase / phosphoribosyl-ATP pyrophosphohydrolase
MIMTIDFKKMGGLVPAVIQDVDSREVLMVGFMNQVALDKTQETGKVTFWSRTKERLWQKGETSGNVLNVVSIKEDCDQDTLLILATPNGPTCHTGERTCFGDNDRGIGFLGALAEVVTDRKKNMPEDSYTTSLFKDGLSQILAKVEEESEEVIRAAREETPQRLAEESGDLLYHLLVLLEEKSVDLNAVMDVLQSRHDLKK